MTNKMLNTSTLIAAVLLIGGCGTQIRLKSSKSFTAQTVRLHSWEDRCKLQAYFDSAPPRNAVLFETGSYAVGPDGKKREVGTTTHRIEHKRQVRKLRSLLSRYFAGVPAVAQRDSFTVTVSYYRYCGKTRMIRGSQIRLDAGGRTALLAYHPCIGEYLLNRDLYATRHLHVETKYASQSRK